MPHAVSTSSVFNDGGMTPRFIAITVAARSIAPLPAPLLPTPPLIARTGISAPRSPNVDRIAAASEASWAIVPIPEAFTKSTSLGDRPASRTALFMANDRARPAA